MKDNAEKLKPIALEYLFDGMVVAEDIYSFDRRVLLLSKGNILTEHKIRQLKEFNANNRNIFVFDSTYKLMIEHGLSTINTLAQEYLEERVGYSSVKDKTAALLEEIKQNDAISKDDTDEITAEMLNKIQGIDPSLVFQCINVPKPIDEYLRRHSVNVGMLNGLMGKWMGLSLEEISQLVLAGFVHDVGKTKIPTEILDAPRKLSLSEFEVMKMHPIYSHNLLSKDERFTADIRMAARHHHEKLNGSGYPDGLVADQISLFARITEVADIYDAMVSKRSYKAATNPFLILAKLANQQFSELDMKLVKLFTSRMPAELVGKPALLSDGSIGIIRFIVPSDLEHPLVEINGEVKKTDKQLYCERMVFDD